MSFCAYECSYQALVKGEDTKLWYLANQGADVVSRASPASLPFDVVYIIYGTTQLLHEKRQLLTPSTYVLRDPSRDDWSELKY